MRRMTIPFLFIVVFFFALWVEGTDGLFFAIKSGDLEYAQEILKDPDFNPNIKHWNNGATPLIHAVVYKQLEIVEALLEHPNIDPNMRSSDGGTPLHYAVTSGDLKIVKALLRHPDLDPTKLNLRGQPPLQMAEYFASVRQTIVEIVEKEITIREGGQKKEGSCYIN